MPPLRGWQRRVAPDVSDRRLLVYGLLPICKGFKFRCQGQVAVVYPACCRSLLLLALMIIRAYRPHRPNDLLWSTGKPGFQYAGLTCYAIVAYCLRNLWKDGL